MILDIPKKNVLERYKLPSKVIFCKRCVISNQRPRITFDKNGICSACHFSNFKKNEINWKSRHEELLKLCDKHRSKNGEFDIVIPCSGGKDGDRVAHQMKHEYGMNPLCVTWAPLKYTDIGRMNLDAFMQSGFNHILGTSDQITTQKLTELSLKELGDPFQPFIYGQSNFPLTIAVKYNIKLLMYGENGEVEYGGDMKNAYKPTRDPEQHIKHYFSGTDVSSWTKFGIQKKDLTPFEAPSKEIIKKKGIEIHFFSYYKYWDPQENFYFAFKNCGFTPNPERNEGTYSKYASLDDKFDGFHFYFAYIKFGIGRTTSDAAHEIRDGKITRDEGKALVKKYDGEFPKKYYQEFLEYCSINEDYFEKIVDSWRSDHIWYKDNEGQWKLKDTVY